MLTSIQRVAFASALASLLAAAPFAAHAGSYASASAGQLRFQLIDLDPNDGIVPSYAFNLGGVPAPGFGTSVAATSFDGSLGWSDDVSKLRDTLFYPVAVDSVTGNGSAHAEVTPSTVSAQGAASGKNVKFTALASTGPVLTATHFSSIYAIDLSPRSVLMVSAWMDSSAWAGNARCGAASFLPDCPYESASASAVMSLSYDYFASGASVSYSFIDEVTVSASSVGSYTYGYNPQTGEYGYTSLPGEDQSKHTGKWLTAIFTNSSDVNQQAALGLSASVFGASNTAIPEASTTAMFALGLLGLVGVARRRA